MINGLLETYKTDNKIYNGIIELVRDTGFAVCEYEKKDDYIIYISRGIDAAIFKQVISRKELNGMIEKYLKRDYGIVSCETGIKKENGTGIYASSVGENINDGAVIIKRINKNIYCCFNFES